jgi:hypothetical protein
VFCPETQDITIRAEVGNSSLPDCYRWEIGLGFGGWINSAIV